ncbi:hypothetical protein [Pedobacter sp.]|uniref:hypothetical protein n=1 Tax=Pedobacter sp. TaxID=1411316 RepID=UPI003D7F59AE
MNLNSKPIHFLLLLVLLTCFVGANGQEKGIIKGVVMEKGTPTRIASATIYNKKTRISVTSNDFGLFQISAVIGDTLQIYKQEYMDVEVVVPSEKDLLVYLNKGNTLNQVNIYGQTKRQDMNDIKKEFRNKGSYYAGKPPLLSYVFTPLTAIYELFGRTPKNAKRFNNYYNSEIQQTEIDGYFNESMIKKHTDLRDKALEDFMLNYRPEYEIVQKWNEYDAIKYIRDAYKKYQESQLKK